MLSSPTFRTLSFFLLYFVSVSGDGTLSVFNVRRQKIEERSDNMESELLSLAIVKVNMLGTNKNNILQSSQVKCIPKILFTL